MEQIKNPLKHLKRNYGNSRSIVSFLSPNKIYKFYNKQLSMKDIMNFLSTTESYTLMKPERKRTIFSKTITYHRRDLFQSDLFYVDRLSSENDGVKYILTVIDCHTKFAFCEPLKDKTAKTVNNNIKIIFDRVGTLPTVFCSDRGKEFDNKLTINYLRKKNIKVFFAQGDTKCAVVERFQQTFQGLIYKYLVQNETYRYIDVLQQLIRNYNETVIDVLGLSPAEAELPQNWERVAAAHSKHRFRMRVKKIKPRFNVDDVVRVTLIKKSFKRSYDITHSHQRYIIHAVNTIKLVPYYILKDEHDNILSGKFYGSQLIKVKIPSYRGYPLKSRMRKSKKEYLMRFTGYSSDYDEWVPSDKLEEINKN